MNLYSEYSQMLAAGESQADVTKEAAIKASRKAAALAIKRGCSQAKAGMIAAAVYKKTLNKKPA